MAEKLIPATQLAEYVYCSQAWQLKLHGAQVSAETRGIQAQANAWHEQQGRSLAAALLAVVLLFCWLGWSR
jgi:hypothetical protein